METQGNQARRIAKNTLYLYASEALSRFFTWALIGYLTRVWEVAQYGQYSTAVNWVTIFVVLSEVGLNALVVREVARDKNVALFYLRNVIVIRSALSILFWGVMIACAFILGYEPILKVVLAVLGVRIILDSIAGGYVYLLQSHEEMGLYSFVNIASGFVRWVFIVLIVHFGGGVIGAGMGWPIASGVALVFLLVIAYRKHWNPRIPDFRMKEAVEILKYSFPLATFGTLQSIYYRVDAVILKSLSGNEMVGYYDLATKIFFMILLIPQLYCTAVYPVFSASQDDDQRFGNLAYQSAKMLILFAFPIAVGGYFLATPIMVLAGGDKYAQSGPIFSVLMFSILPFFIMNVYSSVLAIKNTLWLNLHFLILAVLNVTLNFLMIPRLGALGSAWASVICCVVGLVMGFGFAHHYVHAAWKKLIWPSVASLLSAGLMGLGVYLRPHLYWLALGPLVYVAGLWLFRALDQEEWEKVAHVLRLKK